MVAKALKKTHETTSERRDVAQALRWHNLQFAETTPPCKGS